MDALIRIAITQAEFDAIAKTLPLGSVAFEGKPNENGERIIYLDDWVADWLGAMRGREEERRDSAAGGGERELK
jgi:hypothetical protein